MIRIEYGSPAYLVLLSAMMLADQRERDLSIDVRKTSQDTPAIALKIGEDMWTASLSATRIPTSNEALAALREKLTGDGA